MFQTSGYGQTYASVGDGSVGAQIFQAAKDNVDFVRMVELQKLNLQKRQLRMAEAREAANRRESDRNYQLAQSRFELERRRLDNDFAIRQQERDMAARRYDMAMEEQRQRAARQAMLDEQSRIDKERGFELSRRRLDNDFAIRQQERDMADKRYQLSLEQQRARDARQIGQMELQRQKYEDSRANAIREERNRLLSLGARALGDGEAPKSAAEVLYDGLDGRKYAVPKAAMDKQANRGSSAEVSPAQVNQILRGIDGVINEYSKEDDGKRELEYLLEEADADENLKSEVEKLNKEHTDKKGKVDYGPAIQRVKGAIAAGFGDYEAAESRWEQTAENRRQAAKTLNQYKQAAAENPKLLKAIPPSTFSLVDFGKLPQETIRRFQKYIEDGVFDNEKVNVLIVDLLKRGAKETQDNAKVSREVEYNKEIKRHEETMRRHREKRIERTKAEKPIVSNLFVPYFGY